MRLLAGQVSVLACASVHSVTAGIVPTSPGGIVVLIAERYWLPSERSILNVNVLLEPAWPGSAAVVWVQLTGIGDAQAPPSPLPSTGNSASGGDSDPGAVPQDGTDLGGGFAAAHVSGVAGAGGGAPLEFGRVV